MGFLVIVGVGAIASYLGDSSDGSGSSDTPSVSSSLSGSDAEMLAHFTDYTRSIGIENSVAMSATGKRPDVSTTIGRDGEIQSMVDGLADRLEKSPRDIEGWTLLMRSRAVLGEREDAARAFRKALEVFKDDSVASDKLTAAATEVGLNAE